MPTFQTGLTSESMARISQLGAFNSLLTYLSRQQQLNFKAMDANKAQKLTALKDVLQSHLSGQHASSTNLSRAIVFTQLRSTVSEILEGFSECASVRGRAFIGQANKTSSKRYEANEIDEYFLCGDDLEDTTIASDVAKGMNQFEQANALEQFNSGVSNVLVATSIAEGDHSSAL
jgi:ERCC4-related helicase